MADALSAEVRLPADFADLEQFAATWCLATEAERYAQRLSSSMEELQSFYDAFFPRLEDAIAYCDKFPLDDMPDDVVRLLQLVYSLLMVSFAVEVWLDQKPLNSAGAYLDRVIEPTP